MSPDEEVDDVRPRDRLNRGADVFDLVARMVRVSDEPNLRLRRNPPELLGQVRDRDRGPAGLRVGSSGLAREVAKLLRVTLDGARLKLIVKMTR